MAEMNFAPRARLMLLLGDQLIRDAGIAVFELVKNAYDADASKCSIHLRGVESNAGASIVVEDNGVGMDLSTVKRVWLSPGTRNRLTQREKKLLEKDKPRSERGRLPLGEKGVGRFAAHKLGDHTVMVTRASGEKEIVVTVDWTDFDSDEPLSAIPVKVVQREPQHFIGDRTGTRIEVTELRELPWTRGRVRDLHRAVTSICSPFDGPTKFEPSLKLQPDPGKWLEGLLTSDEVLDLALFKFHGTIEDGVLTYNYDFEPWKGMRGIRKRKSLNVAVPITFEAAKKKRKESQDEGPEAEDLQAALESLGPITIDLRVYDRDRKVLRFLPNNMKFLTDFLDSNGGVRVYRDGVRVFDFGEPGNDWLDLGGRRVNVPARRIGNNQVLGEVRLQLGASKALVEKTNREGFVENAAYRALRKAVRFALTQAESERNVDKQTIRNSDAEVKAKEPVVSELNDLRTELQQVSLTPEETNRLSQYVDRIEIQYREMLDRLITAAGTGLNLSVILHEVEKGIKTLYASLQKGVSNDGILLQARHLAEVVDSLTWLTRQSGTVNTSAKALITHALFAWSYRFEKHDIEVTNGMESNDPDFDIRGTRRLLMTALMNLIDNAIFWVSAGKSKVRSIYVGTTYELTGNPAIVVADNGTGFLDPPDYVTMPFFTRKPDGTGLGLHIADEIMKTHGGELVFPDHHDITVPSKYRGGLVLLQFGEKTK